MNKKLKQVEGAQSVHRALELLELISRHHEEGIELSELIASTRLERTTAYRLVSTLERDGMVERDATSRRYRLGMGSMHIGLATMRRAPLLEECRPLMKTLAYESGDTVFLIVRNGDYAQCLHSESGMFPIQTVTQHVDGLRLLGLGTAGRAMLATLHDDEIESIYRRNKEKYLEHGFSLNSLQQVISNIRSAGHAMTVDIITPGICGVGVAFEIGIDGHAAISIASISERMSANRKIWILNRIHVRLREQGFTAPLPQRPIKK